jgi:hypothetical protein
LERRRRTLDHPRRSESARIHYAEQIAGYESPLAYSVARRQGDEIDFSHLNDIGGTHLLPAVILAFVCGHPGGTATYELTAATFERALRLLAPSEACTLCDHPNLWSWRSLLESARVDTIFVAVFVSDLSATPVDRYDAAFRSLLDKQDS